VHCIKNRTAYAFISLQTKPRGSMHLQQKIHIQLLSNCTN